MRKRLEKVRQLISKYSKKKHFKIDARNHEYDRFYLINYLEAGKDWKQIQDEEEDEPEAKDENWADWVEDVCLLMAEKEEEKAKSLFF